MGDNIFRRNAPAAEAFYLFYLRGTQSGCISKNFIDSRFAFLIYSCTISTSVTSVTPPPAEDTYSQVDFTYHILSGLVKTVKS
jgi:hypothetical protein